MKTIIIVANSRSGHNFIKNIVSSWFPVQNYMNFENYFPSSAKVAFNRLPITEQNNSVNLLVLRDLLNWYASFSILVHGKLYNTPTAPITKIENLRWMSEKTTETDKIAGLTFIPDDMKKEDFLKITHRSDATPEERIKNGMLAWLKCAKEFKNETNYLPDFLKVSYDEFFKNREYRMELCMKIGGTYTEELLNEVTWEGGYSSFDKDSLQNMGQNMNVLKRYSQFSDWGLLKNSEALQYYIDNFDLDDDKLKTINKWIKN